MLIGKTSTPDEKKTIKQVCMYSPSSLSSSFSLSLSLSSLSLPPLPPFIPYSWYYRVAGCLVQFLLCDVKLPHLLLKIRWRVKWLSEEQLPYAQEVVHFEYLWAQLPIEFLGFFNGYLLQKYKCCTAGDMKTRSTSPSLPPSPSLIIRVPVLVPAT